MHQRMWQTEPEPARYGAGEPTEPETGRAGRSIYFLQGARQAAALSVKVANYCTSFEALLSTDTTELSHRLSERLAWLLANSASERLSIFRTVKGAYGIRSRAVHGAHLSKQKIRDELIVASTNCDDLLRRLWSESRAAKGSFAGCTSEAKHHQRGSKSTCSA